MRPTPCTRSADWHDLVVYHGELFERLGLAAPAVAGHSFGALLAAEIAAATSKMMGRLVLIDPVGLWRDDHPVKNWMLLPEKARRAALFADPAGEAAKHFYEIPSDPEARVDALSQFGPAAPPAPASFCWPIADRGFGARAHRIAAPSLIVWGKADGIIAPVYADEFAHRIGGAAVALIEAAGHAPHLERPDAGDEGGAGLSRGLTIRLKRLPRPGGLLLPLEGEGWGGGCC